MFYQKLLIVVLVLGSVSLGANAQNAATDILNQSLGSVGKCVVITVKSSTGKTDEFTVQIPGDKYSPPGNNADRALDEIKKQVSEAIEKAKKESRASATVTVTVERKLPTPKH